MRALLLTVALVLAGSASCAAATITTQIDPSEVSAGAPATLTLTIQNGEVQRVDLPTVDGLSIQPGASSVTYAFNSGALATTTTRKFQLIASRPGEFTVPPFDLILKDGSAIQSQGVPLRVTPPPPGAVNPAPSAGPVTLPPVDPSGGAPPSENNGVNVPYDPDGTPARVFMRIQAQTTDAYVGQMVPLRIDFFIRADANADQDSLPTIKGSDFLMNDFAVRGHASIILLADQQYECDTFLSAFAAPKSGDFPLASERDTYWVKAGSSGSMDPLGFTHQTNLAHGMITTNQLIMHIRPLPAEGRPEHFSGAVGQFQVSSDAQPAVIAMGEPALLTYGISGVGNFDYVRCPVLADDPHWKVYPPKSSMVYTDEERTEGAKTFEQSVIPRENGNVPLPQATFSYFDPYRRQYVSVPINLPTIAVTGAMPLPGSSAASPPVNPTTTATMVDEDFAPNRAELGDLMASLTPVYRHAWFWTTQAVLAGLPLLGLLIYGVRRWVVAGAESAESLARRRALRHEESAMAEALRHNQPRAFFLAARHALQLHLGAQWALAPEAITLGEIRRRDPDLAQTLTPFFAQADEILYSGRAGWAPDLAHWAGVARAFLQPRPA